ncbi:MAG: tRNA preQ1(34) S-adenosylmethionine ribosyltransferase-isomerase QueA [Rugosibacter sp.]|nr:tRNA preQ1(34) S-adenosylmethionine ribosyltransferase-isomerase QueA [Rugosibacter sp.]MDO9273460.1 tRNA preQ1(34) S-adenosylmethionine ribosyltransferase-isomerase QueA [Rugosibacter sp.]
MNPLTLADFDYALPQRLIAQAPLAQRSASRLLNASGKTLLDQRISDLPSVLQPGDLLVMNDSRVMHARLQGVKATGGQVEVLVERILSSNDVLAQVRASKSPKTGSRLILEGLLDVEVLGREGEFYRLRLPGEALETIEAHGRLPLPPYIARAAVAPDETRYQTVYARETGSVAAPTAGLHFDEDLLAKVRAQGVTIAYVTLHVGAGTFQPVRTQTLAEHHMHTERYTISPATAEAIAETKARGGRVIAVGTTTLRALESAATGRDVKVGAGETAIFITPGFEFQVVDALLTNFHLPKSTLLMLVSAFAGVKEIRAAYRHAIEQGYRFFSYGDAMWLTRKPVP